MEGNPVLIIWTTFLLVLVYQSLNIKVVIFQALYYKVKSKFLTNSVLFLRKFTRIIHTQDPANPYPLPLYHYFLLLYQPSLLLYHPSLPLFLSFYPNQSQFLLARSPETAGLSFAIRTNLCLVVYIQMKIRVLQYICFKKFQQ